MYMPFLFPCDAYCISYLVDFVKLLRVEEFHQENRMDYTSTDMLDGHATQETSESTFGGCKDYTDNTLISADASCPGKIGICTNISSIDLFCW